jgi:pSer/pThr/pTyr-binding forkhead associated (FHA) protein
MNAIEAEFLFARAVLLLLLYGFIAAVAWLAWRDLRRERRSAEAGPAAPATRLIVLDAGATGLSPGVSFPLGAVASLGRDLDNDVVLADPTISGHHAVVNRREGAWWVEDLQSTNGTHVHGEVVPPAVPTIVRSGDIVQVGGVRLRLVTPEL